METTMSTDWLNADSGISPAEVRTNQEIVGMGNPNAVHWKVLVITLTGNTAALGEVGTDVGSGRGPRVGGEKREGREKKKGRRGAKEWTNKSKE